MNNISILYKWVVSTAMVLLFTLCAYSQSPVWQTADQKNASGSGTSLSVVKPSNLAVNDLIILIFSTQRSDNSTAKSFTTPAGFTLIRAEHDITSNKRPEMVAFYRIVTGTEGATFTSTVTNNGDTPHWKAVAGRVTGHDVSNPISANSGTNSGSSKNLSITIPTLNTTNNDALLIAAATVRQAISGQTLPAGMTQVYFANGTGSGDNDDNPSSLHIGRQNIPTAGATGTKVFSWTGDARAVGLMFSIKRVECSPVLAKPIFNLTATSNRCKGSGTVTYTATATGATSISYTLDAASIAAGNSIIASTGAVTYSSSWEGVSTITATAQGCQGPTSAVHKATTYGTLGAPVFFLGSTSGRCIEEETRVYAASALNSTSIIYSLDAASRTKGAYIFSNIGSVYYPPSFSGTAVITATATGCGVDKIATHTVTVSSQGALDDKMTMSQDKVKSINVLINDFCDIDTASVTVVSNPTKGIAVVNNQGLITYTPNAGYFGLDSLTYRVCGKASPTTCSTAKLRITVTQVFTDTYFNLPASNCQAYPDNSTGLTIRFQYATADSISLYTNPMIADLDGDGTIEMVALSSTNISTTSGQRSSKDLKIIRGSDGKTIRNITTPFISWDGPTPIAIADVDRDGDVEIIVASSFARNGATDQNYLYCYDHLGALVWKSNVQYGLSTPGNSSAPAIGLADFNHDGIPEVYVYNEIFNARTGVKLATGGTNGKGIQATYLSVEQAISVAGNVTPSANLELIAGRTVYEVVITNTNGLTGNSMTAKNISVSGNLLNDDGLTALADMDLDGELDVVVISANANLYIYNPRTMTLMGQRSSGSTQQRGALFIGDVDGNGVPNIGYCRSNAVDMLQYNKTTASLSLKWTLTTTDGSGRTGLTMFDFDQDGIQEIVYRDETTLRIINGSSSSPITMFSIPAFSTTGMEGPIVADIDNDGAAEIIVTSEGGSSDGDRISTINVYRSDSFKWAPSRKVWNQYAYYNVHINDNLMVTKNQANHGTQFFASSSSVCPETIQSRPLNAFNVQSTLFDDNGCPVYSVADAELVINSAPFDESTLSATVNYTARNRGDAVALPIGVQVTFYDKNPLTVASAKKITTTLPRGVDANGKQGVYSAKINGVREGDTIYGLINDDGTKATPLAFPVTTTVECNYRNNLMPFIIRGPSALGVDLLQFVAYRNGRNVNLEWVTSSEINNDYFVVERSVNGKDWRSLDTIQGNGNSTERIDYESLDNNPSSGVNYYRLYQVDFDGTYSYSQIVAVNFEEKSFAVFPNPANKELSIISPFESGRIEITDVLGKSVYSGEIKLGRIDIDVEALLSGIYVVRITSTYLAKSEIHRIRILH